MYKALKTAQMQIHESLLKLTDDIIQAVEATKPELLNSNKPETPSSPLPDLHHIQHLSEMLTYVHMKQETQFKEITSAIEDLNKNMAVLMATMPKATMPTATMPTATMPNAQTSQPSNSQTVSAEFTIPTLHPTSAPSEIISSVKNDESAIELQEDVEVEESDVELEDSEHDVDVQEAEEEAEVEVEEWTYKGVLFFKDSNDVVYSNEDGDVGEPVGKYDSIKKILKKI